jgi:hypothetical protein
MGQRALKIWIFVSNITNEFVSGLDIQRPYDLSVNLGLQTLRLAEEEVSLWSPGAGPWPSRLVVANDLVISAHFEGVVMDRSESPLGVESGRVEPSMEAHPLEGLYIARILVRDRWEVPVGVQNATCHEQSLTKGCPLAH